MSTIDAAGRRRLGKVAKYCVKYGQRVQNSVFECMVDESQFRVMQNDLQKLIDTTSDSIRFYNLGVKYKTKIIHLGIRDTYDPEDILML